MYTLDIILKTTPIPLSVDRKEEADAKALYAELLAALQDSSSRVIELGCDKQAEKKIAVLSGEIVAVQLSEKGAAGTTGKGPGFFAQLLEP